MIYSTDAMGFKKQLIQCFIYCANQYSHKPIDLGLVIDRDERQMEGKLDQRFKQLRIKGMKLNDAVSYQTVEIFFEGDGQAFSKCITSTDILAAINNYYRDHCSPVK